MDYISKPNEIKGIMPGSPLKMIGRGTIKLDFLVTVLFETYGADWKFPTISRGGKIIPYWHGKFT